MELCLDLCLARTYNHLLADFFKHLKRWKNSLVKVSCFSVSVEHSVNLLVKHSMVR